MASPDGFVVIWTIGESCWLRNRQLNGLANMFVLRRNRLRSEQLLAPPDDQIFTRIELDTVQQRTDVRVPFFGVVIVARSVSSS